MRTCKHCGSHVEWTEGWNHDDGFVYCGDVGGTKAEPEDPRPEFERACAYCGVTILWDEDIDFWVHDDGSILCSGGVRGVATPELPDEIDVESNSRSENPVSQNSGPKNGSDQKSGPPFKVEPAQPVTPQEEKGGVIYDHFETLTIFLYEHKNKFTKEEQLELLDHLDALAGDIDDIEDAVNAISGIVFNRSY